jgi:hypothetical protein
LKEFAQHFWLLGVMRHSVHLGLQLLRSDWRLPVIPHRLRIAQIVFDFSLQLRLSHHSIERWLGIGALFWPGPMTPVNFLNGSLVSYAVSKRQRFSRNVRRRFRTKESKQRS